MKLRQGVKFTNGKTFNADDVVATFDRLVDPKAPSAGKSAFSFLDKGGHDEVDDYTALRAQPAAGVPHSLSTYQAAILPADW